MTDSKVPTFDIEVYQGETWTMTMNLTDDNNAAKDLTGYTAKLDVRPNPGGDLLLHMETGGQGITITGATGQIDFALTAAQTSVLAFETGRYYLFIVSGAGSETPLIRGQFTVTQKVTQ